MSDSEQSGEDLRAWATRMGQEGGNDDWPAVALTDFGGEHLPADRIATFGTRIGGHIEHPAEMWPMLRTIDMDPGNSTEWAEPFARAAETDTDAQGSASVWQLDADGEAGRA
ncbi:MULTISPECIES: hypothetical protein [unclassified Streptomyces]|uniref:hypothetical protein n=1 Tax=unclassified Streptomyces TaxID=2593676 RepID=UPI003328DE77